MPDNIVTFLSVIAGGIIGWFLAKVCPANKPILVLAALVVLIICLVASKGVA